MNEYQGEVANDSSGNGNTGNITIGATGSQSTVGTCTTVNTAWGNGVSGKYSASLNFDGSDDYVAIPTGLLNGLNDATISFWAKGTGNPWGQGDSSTSTFMESTRLYFRGSLGTQDWTITNPFSAGSWNHFVIVRTPTSLAIYKNGTLSQGPQSFSASGTITTTATYGLQYGRVPAGSGGSTSYFTDQIDDVKVFNYALTDTQINTIYNYIYITKTVRLGLDLQQDRLNKTLGGLFAEEGHRQFESQDNTPLVELN